MALWINRQGGSDVTLRSAAGGLAGLGFLSAMAAELVSYTDWGPHAPTHLKLPSLLLALGFLLLALGAFVWGKAAART
jgi:hypothetical protein